MITKNAKRKSKVDLSVYEHKVTKENLIDGLPKDSSVSVTSKTNEFTLKSKYFFSVDINNLNECISEYNLSINDLGYIMKIAMTTHKKKNIVYNYSVPHNNTTLQKYLGFKSQSKYFELISRLIDSKVLYKHEDKTAIKSKFVYIMNPYLSKSRTIIDGDIIAKVRHFGEKKKIETDALNDLKGLGFEEEKLIK